MTANILGEEYDISTTTTLNLSYKSLTELRVDKKQSFLSSPVVMNRKSETFSIHDVPKSIGSLSNLQELYLNNNKLTSLSKSIGRLSNLKILYLDNNNLTELPKSIGSLYNLQTLSLDNNRLINVPESIQSLSKLKYLSLTNNKLTSLWVDKKPCFLSSPMVMNRKSETFSIHDAPESIESLSNLEYLYLYNNNLTSLPKSIGSLSNLKILFLANNKLTNIPESMQTLTKIKRFELDESSYDINNLSMDCHILVLTSIKNNITNLPPILRTLYLKSDINVDMIKLPYGCDIIRF
jgi:Leucine-rich repeat (LRR) protein